MAAGGAQFLGELDKPGILDASCPGRAVLDTGAAENAFLLFGCYLIILQGDSADRTDFRAFSA